MSTPDDPTEGLEPDATADAAADSVSPLGASPLDAADDAFVVQLLSADAADDPLPPAVAARWDTAIAAESATRTAQLRTSAAVAAGATTITPMRPDSGTDRSGRRLRFAGVAASVAAIALVGGIVANSVFSKTSTNPDTITANSAPLPLATSVSTSGLQYRPTGISAQLGNLLKGVPFKQEAAATPGVTVTLPETGEPASGTATDTGAAADPTPSQPSTSTKSSGAEAGGNATSTAALEADPMAVAFRSNEQRRTDCLQEINEGPGAQPVLLDLGYFEKKSAALIVLPTTGDPTRLDVWIVGPDCTTGNADVFWFGRILRP